jgi:DNA-3-methyladenine glycosylase I
VPSHDDRHLFEMLVLEGAQAGLSWSTILRKSQSYRKAFAGFDREAVARFGPRDLERLLADPGIVRNRAKVEAAIGNARAAIEAAEEHGSLDAFLWGLVGGRPIRNRWRSLDEVPAQTDASRALSRELKATGVKDPLRGVARQAWADAVRGGPSSGPRTRATGACMNGRQRQD